MAIVTIREVAVEEQSLILSIEFDFEVVSGQGAHVYQISISKPDFLYWKEYNPTGTLDDYIITLVQPHYDKLKAQRDLAVQLNLLNKELSW